MKFYFVIVTTILSVFLASVTRANEVTYWNTVALDAIKTTNTTPPQASRALAIVHTAVFDAVNSIGGAYLAYKYNTAAPAGSFKEAAAAQAAFTTLSALFPTVDFSGNLAARLSLIPDDPGKTSGLTVGLDAANYMLTLRSNDGSASAGYPYGGSNVTGKWSPTPPGYADGLLPGWGQVTPFAVPSGSHNRAGLPPDLSSQEYADAANEVKALGRSTGSSRTNDQTEIAFFWADGAGTVTPPGHWNQIAANAGISAGLTIDETARMFALLNMGLADAAISCWDTKYYYDLWRPVSAIISADTGNPLVESEAEWTPLLTTPPFPTYTSGHSTFSGTAARILSELFGDDHAFADTSESLGITRNFTSFSHAAQEAGMSRIYGGIHFSFDNTAGLECGDDIGSYVVVNYLQPVPEPSSAVVLGSFGIISAMRRFTLRRRANTSAVTRG